MNSARYGALALSCRTYRIIRRTVAAGFIAFSVPLVSRAQIDVDLSAGSELQGFVDTLEAVFDILNDAIIPIIIALATIYFLWGVVSYVIAKGPEEKERAKDTMIYGLIGLFVIFAVWGLLALIGNLIGVTPGKDADIPTFEASGSGGGTPKMGSP